MSVDQLSAVPKSEQASAIATVVSAFTDDPVERWLFLDTDEYLTHVSALAWRQPRHARAGLGGELLTSCLAMAGDSHLPAYRETPTHAPSRCMSVTGSNRRSTSGNLLAHDPHAPGRAVVATRAWTRRLMLCQREA